MTTRRLAVLCAVAMALVGAVNSAGAETASKPKPYHTAQPWNPYLAWDGSKRDFGYPLGPDGLPDLLAPWDRKQPPVGDAGWQVITGDGRVKGRDCLGDFRYPACIAETMLACDLWSYGWAHPICAHIELLPLPPGFSSDAPKTPRWEHSFTPWSVDIYYMLRVYEMEGLIPEEAEPLAFRQRSSKDEGFRRTQAGDIGVVFFGRQCRPGNEFLLPFATARRFDRAGEVREPLTFAPNAPKDQCFDYFPAITVLRPMPDGRFAIISVFDGKRDSDNEAWINWIHNLTPYGDMASP